MVGQEAGHGTDEVGHGKDKVGCRLCVGQGAVGHVHACTCACGDVFMWPWYTGSCVHACLHVIVHDACNFGHVCMCACVCVITCASVCVHAVSCACVFAFMCAWVHVCTSAIVLGCTSVDVHVCIMWSCVLMCMKVCLCICACLLCAFPMCVCVTVCISNIYSSHVPPLLSYRVLVLSTSDLILPMSSWSYACATSSYQCPTLCPTMSKLVLPISILSSLILPMSNTLVLPCPTLS